MREEFKTIDIGELKETLEGRKVKIAGWIYTKNVLGKLIFYRIRDGTGIIQVAIKRGEIPEDEFEEAAKALRESSVSIEGILRRDPRAPNGLEVRAKNVKILGESLEDYPIKPGETVEFLLDNRHLHIRGLKMNAVMRIRAKTINIMREWLEKRGYVEVHAPTLITAACEGGATLFEVKYFDRKAYLTQSSQLYLEALIYSLGKVYTIQPSFRAEKSRTRRHLTEFWHLEVEEAFASQEDIMRIEEELLIYTTERVKEECRRELSILGREIEKIEAPFRRITYDEAIEALNKEGLKIKVGEDFGVSHEKRLCKIFGYPLFVTHYPREIRAFYHKPSSDPRRVICHDLLIWPYGEIIGGGQRIDDYNELLVRIKESKLDPSEYRWYLDLRKFGSVPHSGFGLGVERFVAYLCKLDHIRDAIPFPRTPARVYP